MKRYPTYKDSGVEWLEKVPADWSIKRLKMVSDILPSNVDKKSKVDEKDVMLCNYVDVYKNDFITAEINFMVATATDAQIEKLSIREGDVIATKDSEDPNDIGVPAFVQKTIEGVVCGYHLTLIRSDHQQVRGSYLYWLMRSNGCAQYFSTEARGITRYAIGARTFSNLAIPVPDSVEQNTIANYLDHKTSQIDTLISKKEKLIELLKEERAAMINQAVTKGLDPNVPMKDSGIEWLGEIPVHWEVKKLKYVAVLKSGENIISEQIKAEGKYPVYGGNGLRGYYSDYTNKGNYILIGRQGALCGNIKYASEKFWASEHAIVSYLFDNYEWIWFGKLLEVMNLNQYSQSAAQPGLAVSEIKNLSVPSPTFVQQRQIVDYINKEQSRIDTLVEKTAQEIELLKEYKSALISEVVTGKVDVRDEVLH